MINKNDKHYSSLWNLYKRENNFQESINHVESYKVENLLHRFYHAFIQNHPDNIVEISLIEKKISFNKRRLHEELGYDLNEQIAFEKLVSKEDYTILDAAFHKALKGKLNRVAFTVYNKHGKMIDAIGTFIPVEMAMNQVDSIYVTVKDITAQKKLAADNGLNTNFLEQAEKITKIGTVEYFISTNEIKCSKPCLELFGLESNEGTTIDTLLSLVHHDDYEEMKQLFSYNAMKVTSYSTEFRISHNQTNALRHLKIQAEIIEKDNNQFKFIGVLHDVTDQNNGDKQLMETNNSYQHIFDHLHVGIWMRDSLHGKITYASKGMGRILQVPLETIYGDPLYWKNLILPEYREVLFEKYKLLGNGESMEYEYEISTGDGSTRWIYEQTIPKFNASGEIIQYFGMIMDVTTRVEMRRELEFLAKHDALTNLPNVHSLHDQLDFLIHHDDERPYFALLYIELDDFKWINDYVGHQMGHIVLKKIANNLATILPSNGYLAKVENETFMIIIPNYENKEAIFVLAELLMTTIKQQIEVEDYRFHVTANLGISLYPENGDDKLILIENAHTALYHARNLGKNNVQFYSLGTNISSHKKYMLEHDLRQAIQNEDFELYYQPQINPRNGEIEGAEALIRWNHPSWGIVSPAEFIPLAEEKHLIHLIGKWVIRTVCQQLHKWKAKGWILYPVAINISPIHFLIPGLVTTIKEALAHYQVSAEYIQLEITESALLKNEENVSSMLGALREMGIKVALDDFGTGYSSFHYLQKYDLDILKIDQSFIQNLHTETKETAIVASFLHLAKGLNMKVIAEGVEEHEQLDFLIHEQCDSIQGYLYSKPVPLHEYERIMKNKYLQPKVQQTDSCPMDERRSHFRFTFPAYLSATMNIIEGINSKISFGSESILVENISLGGIRFLSTLNLPIESNVKLNFSLELMNEIFDLSGSLVYKNEALIETYAYGVGLNISEKDQARIKDLINKMSVLHQLDQDITGTDFIYETPHIFLGERTK